LKKKVCTVKKTNQDYSAFVALSRDELLARLEAQLSAGRFAHVQRVEQTAIRLAQQYGADVQRAGLAGLVHDYAKQTLRRRI
jgi:HD superfamily phosphohydrolase YqeK